MKHNQELCLFPTYQYCTVLYCTSFVQADPRYETATSVKAQIKFLEELDSLERKRHEEVQRGVLLRAAKVGERRSCRKIVLLNNS